MPKWKSWLETMPLQSALFRDDRRLQACLVEDDAHVTPGSIGPYVSRIQAALLLLTQAQISTAEIVDQRYGDLTAAAVLGNL